MNSFYRVLLSTTISVGSRRWGSVLGWLHYTATSAACVFNFNRAFIIPLYSLIALFFSYSFFFFHSSLFGIMVGLGKRCSINLVAASIKYSLLSYHAQINYGPVTFEIKKTKTNKILFLFILLLFFFFFYACRIFELLVQ